MSVKRGLAVFSSFLVAACLFSGCNGGEEQEKEDIVVYMPDGAPAMALAGAMAEDTETDGVEYRVVAPALISSKVTAKKEEENADLCVLPVTAASKLLGDGERYRLLGTLTHGNLYLVAKGEGALDLRALVGKRVGVLQINEVPGLTFKATLNGRNLPWQELKNGGEIAADKVNLLAISGADAVGSVEAEYFLLAEPAATAQAKKGYRIVGDLQELYGEGKGYPQAVLVAKRSIAEKKEVVEDFLDLVQKSAAWLRTASGEEIVAAVASHIEDSGAATSLKAPLLTAEVVARCGVRFTYAAEDYQEIGDFLTALCEVNDKAAAIPNQNFYWR